MSNIQAPIHHMRWNDATGRLEWSRAAKPASDLTDADFAEGVQFEDDERLETAAEPVIQSIRDRISDIDIETRDAGGAGVEKRFVDAGEVRAEGGGTSGKPTKIVGHAALYNSLSKPMKTSRGTTFRERILPGAFDGALKDGADVMGRYNHELILGRTTSGTMKLSLDADGLRYEITPPDSMLADHVVKSVQRGDVKGSSFAFRTIKDKWRMEDGAAVRELESVGLVDCGPVDSPAYGATAEGDAAVSMRSLGTDEAAVDRAVAEISGKPAPAQTRSEKRYYYNPQASSLTQGLRDAIDNCRSAQDGASEVLDLMSPRPGYQPPQWGDAETRAAQDLADEITDTIGKLQTLAGRLPKPAPDDAGVGANSDKGGDQRAAATPLLDDRRRRARAKLV